MHFSFVRTTVFGLSCCKQRFMCHGVVTGMLCCCDDDVMLFEITVITQGLTVITQLVEKVLYDVRNVLMCRM